MTQPFRLQTILNLRKEERDHHSIQVAAARARLANCMKDQERIGVSRQNAMDELRRLNDGVSWTLDYVTDCQAHLAHLRNEQMTADRDVAEAELAFNACLSQFLKADQAFRGLERLAEKHTQAEAARMARRSLAEFDDSVISRWHRANS